MFFQYCHIQAIGKGATTDVLIKNVTIDCRHTQRIWKLDGDSTNKIQCQQQKNDGNTHQLLTSKIDCVCGIGIIIMPLESERRLAAPLNDRMNLKKPRRLMRQRKW